MNADLTVSLINTLVTTGDKYAIKLKIAKFDKLRMILTATGLRHESQ